MMKLLPMFRRPVFLVLLVAFLQACSPAMNWREVPNTEAGYVATFPDKPAQVTRTLDLIGLKVPLTLHAAQVQGLYFAVGTVPLDGALKGHLPELTQALAQALANNINAGQAELKPLNWLGMQVGELRVSGVLKSGKTGFAHGRFFEHRGVLYEVLLMGDGAEPDADVLTQWFKGFRLLGR